MFSVFSSIFSLKKIFIDKEFGEKGKTGFLKAWVHSSLFLVFPVLVYFLRLPHVLP